MALSLKKLQIVQYKVLLYIAYTKTALFWLGSVIDSVILFENGLRTGLSRGLLVPLW